MEARKEALISRHIVLFGFRHPCAGVILIEDGVIHSVELASATDTPEELMRRYEDWNPVNYENYYVSPGIIDCNVRVNGEWEGYRSLTKAAISGGVTMIIEEPSIFDLTCRDSELYCDVGKAFLASNSNIGCLEAALAEGVFAVKGYLSAPSAYVESIDAVISRLLDALTQAQVPLLLDVCYPNSRHVYMSSPCRFQTIENRLKFDGKTELGLGAGAFPEDDAGTPIEESDSPKENTSSERTSSEITTSMRRLRMSVNGPACEEKLSFGTIPEVKEEEDWEVGRKTTFERTKKRHASLHLQLSLFKDLEARLHKAQDSFQELFEEEFHSYREAGQTVFETEPVRKRSSSFAVGGMSPYTPADSEGSSPGEPSKYQGRVMGIRPVALQLIKASNNPEVERERTKTYNRHLANFPERWERKGIEILSVHVANTKCRVHLCNLGSPLAITKAKNIGNQQISCETCPHYLFFSSTHIGDGHTQFKTCPPIRSPANSEHLWELLKLKGIDMISSHHTPVLPSLKFRETGNFRKAVNGITGLGFTLQSVWTKLVKQCGSEEEREHYIVRLSKWLSLHPAMLLGVADQRGAIEKGKSADLVVWKPEESEVISTCHSLYPTNCPYVGQTLQGKVHKVYLRGLLVYNEGVHLAKGRRLYRSLG